AVSAVLQNATLYSQAIDAMSMRNRNPASNGHDHFFASFSRFNLPSNSRTGDMLAEVASRAAAEHVSYLELMITPDGGMASRLGRAAGWDADLARQRDSEMPWSERCGNSSTRPKRGEMSCSHAARRRPIQDVSSRFAISRRLPGPDHRRRYSRRFSPASKRRLRI